MKDKGNFNMKMTIIFSFIVTGFPILANAEDCGPPVYPQGGALERIDKTFNDGKHAKAAAKWFECSQRNDPAEITMTRAIESCKQAIRRVTASPSTLSFAQAYMPPSTTEGGYSIGVGGQSSAGQFYRKCYMDKNFNVTEIK